MTGENKYVRKYPSFAPLPNERDQRIIKSLPMREFLFIMIVMMTVTIFETYQLYTDWGIWWGVFLLETIIMLKLVTGYPRYGGVDALIMLPLWIPFHLLYVLVAWIWYVSLLYISVSWLFGSIGVVASGIVFLILHGAMWQIQIRSWRVYP